MKICAIICEYNPFHNGHAYHISQAKRLSGADAVLCVMSGNFVQRGEAALLEKHLRAKHALLAGADAVLELPAVFATSNAEIFARGAVKLLSAIPAVTHLCFGAEHTDEERFLRLARLLINEPKAFSLRLKALTAEGVSYPKAYARACEELFGESVCSPNDILGLEYTKALLKTGAEIRILPVLREGSGYTETTLQSGFASATAIREELAKGNKVALRPYLPQAVYDDLPIATQDRLTVMERAALLTKTASELKKILDCTEGLENAFLKAAARSDEFSKTLTSARYTSSRIRRIALHNLLNIQEDFIRECLSSPLYLNPLGYKRENGELLNALSKASLPFLSSGKAIKALTETARAAFEKEEQADVIYAAVKNLPPVSNSPVIL